MSRQVKSFGEVLLQGPRRLCKCNCHQSREGAGAIQTASAEPHFSSSLELGQLGWEPATPVPSASA